MKCLMFFVAVWALAAARPEQYKEKEDFQFSRSSSDDGTKAGFYGAQRGNMGGNFERAHNMDSLAQNQMSGLVRQVEGELGDGAKMKAGSVYSAANSRGTYGSGHFDLGNLAGRNFQESTSYGDSQAHHSQSSLSSSSAYNAAAYANSQSQSSRSSGYQATGHSGLNLQSDNLQALDNTKGTNSYDYGRQSDHRTGYNAQPSYQLHGAFDTNSENSHSGYGSNIRTRFVSATPVRIIVTPGTRVAIPLSAQSYNIAHGSSLIDQNSLNSDAEVLSNNNQRTAYRPTNPKHYESSYNYRKEWEKHDTIPSNVLSVPTSTGNPFPKNSELYEDGQTHTASNQYDARRVDSQRAQSSSIYSGYNANVKSASGQSRLNYDAQHNGASSLSNTNGYALAGYNGGSNHQESSSDSSLNAYNMQSQYNAGIYHGAAADSSSLTQARHNAGHSTGYNADLNSQVENLNGKPKSYQSSYSYHKSWERQGDPYVIKPASSAYSESQSPQRLTAGSTNNQGYMAAGSHYQHSHQSEADCDDNGHIRVARSYDIGQHQDMQQQSQNMEDLGQQVEDLGQQSQNMEDFGQQVQDLGQQSQNMEDFGQQVQDLGQQSQNMEDLGQQVEDLGQKSQNLEDLGQQVEDLGQQTQTHWGHQEAGQQAQNTWDNLEDLSQQSQKKWDEVQNSWDKFEDLSQKPQDINKQLEQNNQNDLGQRSQDTATELKNNPQDQQVRDKWNFTNTRQDNQKHFQTYNHDHEQSNTFNQQKNQSGLNNDDFFQYSQASRKQNDNKTDQISMWDKFDFGSYQNVQQNKSASEHTNFNGNQVNWSSVSQHRGIDQQPLNSGSNVDNTQQSFTFSGTNEPSNTGFLNLNNQNQLQKDENSYQENHKLYESHNIYSNSHRQEQTTNTDSYSHVSTLEAISPNRAPLFNLWNKLDNIEQQSTLSTGIDNIDEGERNFSQENTNSQNANENSRRKYHMDGIPQEHLDSGKDTQQNKSKDTQTENGSSLDIGRGDIETEKESSLDFGRGDIGPEDLTDPKPYKYPFDTPVNVETIHKKVETPKNELSVLGLERNENLEQQNTQQVDQHKNTEQKNLQVFKQHENVEQTNVQDFGNQDNLEQQNLQDFAKQENLEQQNLQVFGQLEKQEHTIQDFSQHEHKEEDNLQVFKQHENVEQTNIQNFGHHENAEQHNLQVFGQYDNVAQTNVQDSGNQDNLEQQNLQDFAKQENLEQQNLQVFGQLEKQEHTIQDFSQHEHKEEDNLQVFKQHENVEQTNIQNFGHHENAEQHNLQVFGQYDNVEQTNVQDSGKQYNLEQQNLHDFGNHDNLEQQNLKNVGQENMEQHNLQDFGQQENMEQQNLQHFDHQENLEQQNLQDYGNHDKLEQHNLQSFGQQENLEQQNLQDFGQHDNLEQQNLQDFGQQENLEQQNLQDFGHQENLEQQNLHDFGNHDKLEQQNIQNFGQENLEQQNLQNFGQQENMEQQNLQEFRHQENLEQQNLKDFGHQENLKQYNLQDFGRQDNLEQQNLQNVGHKNLQDFTSQANLGQSASFDQQNVQDFEQNENLDQQNLEQLNKDSIQHFKYSKEQQLTFPRSDVQSQTDFPPPEEIEETIEVKRHNSDLQSTSAPSSSTEIVPSIEPVTEKTGFWKSVGNKFSSAKSKIKS